MSISELLKLLKDIGFLRVAQGISFVAWFILPFWVWLIVKQYVENGFFVLNLAIPGLILLIANSIIMGCQVYFLGSHEFRLMKLVEKSAAALFRDPEDPKKAEEFKDECRKIIIPYTHHLPFARVGVSEFMRRPKRLIYSSILYFYLSYSVITFLIVFQSELEKLFDPLASMVYRIIPSQLIEWPFLNVWVSLGIFWALSLFFDPTVSYLRKLSPIAVPKGRVAFFYLTSLYNSAIRILCVTFVFHIPSLPARLTRVVNCEPFIDPLTLPRIVQKTMQNVEGKSCDISRWSEKIENEADVDRIKELTLGDPSTPFFLKMLARAGRSKDVLETIKEMQPITYVGIYNERCVFLGMVLYDPIKRVRVGYFYFDTTYLKKEFLLIYTEEVKKQRLIEKKLPSQLEELIKSLRWSLNS